MNYTILTPTYNRTYYLKRFLQFHHNVRTKNRIIIGDSSTENYREDNKKLISEYDKLNIDYVEFPTDIFFFHKQTELANMSDTDYTVYCSDDDFHNPRGVRDCIEFLSKNKNYSSAHGYYIKFNNTPQILHWHETYITNGIESDDIKKRVQSILVNYSSTWYSVHRTKHLQLSMNENRDFDLGYEFSEICPAVMDAIYGKIKVIDSLYYVLQKKTVAERKKEDLENVYPGYESLPDMIKSGTYRIEYEKFKNCLVKHLVENSDMDERRASSFINRCMKAHYRSDEPKIAPRRFTKDDIKELNMILNHVNTSNDRANYVWLDNIGLVEGPNNDYYS